MLSGRGKCEERCGVCIVRVVRQSTGLLMTVIERLDVDEASTETEQMLTGMPATLDAVRDFIVRFAADCPEGWDTALR